MRAEGATSWGGASRWGRLLGEPSSPADLRPASSPVYWSSCVLSGLVVMLGVSVGGCEVVPAGIALGYSLLAGLAQGAAVRFYLRRKGRSPLEHGLTVLCGGLLAAPLPVLGLFASAGPMGLLVGGAPLVVATSSLCWAAFAAALAPASWLSTAIVPHGEPLPLRVRQRVGRSPTLGAAGRGRLGAGLRGHRLRPGHGRCAAPGQRGLALTNA